MLSRTDPDIVEETETGYIKRLPKNKYLKVDDRHVKHPLIAQPIEFFKEDENYYYISVAKPVREELAAKSAAAPAQQPHDSTPAPPRVTSAVPLSDFEDLEPRRAPASFALEAVSDAGLPEAGMWRASFRMADVNGDGIPDIVSPPARLGDGDLKIWIGDGRVTSSCGRSPSRRTARPSSASRSTTAASRSATSTATGRWTSSAPRTGRASCRSSAMGRAASRSSGRACRSGTSRRRRSSSLDADGDGKLDLVASRDGAEQEPGQAVDKMQVRVYQFLGRDKGWQHLKEGIVGGFYSNCLSAWDYDGDGRQDVLTGSHYTGALTLLWKSRGDGTFAPVSFPAIEVYSYHFATAPGKFGKNGAPAFADSILMATNVPENARAAGMTLYALEGGEWKRYRLWRKKDPKTSVYGLAMGDLDGDGLDDVVFLDNDRQRVRILLQQAGGAFVEIPEEQEPVLASPGQTIRLADLDRDGRLDVVVSKTVTSADPRSREAGPSTGTPQSAEAECLEVSFMTAEHKNVFPLTLRDWGRSSDHPGSRRLPSGTAISFYGCK